MEPIFYVFLVDVFSFSKGSFQVPFSYSRCYVGKTQFCRELFSMLVPTFSIPTPPNSLGVQNNLGQTFHYSEAPHQSGYHILKMFVAHIDRSSSRMIHQQHCKQRKEVTLHLFAANWQRLCLVKLPCFPRAELHQNQSFWRCFFFELTLPATNGWTTSFLLGWPIFRCYVSFRQRMFVVFPFFAVHYRRVLGV